MKAVLKNRQKWNHLLHGLANWGPWAKSGPPPVFIGKILLEHSRIHLFTSCL